MECSGIPPKPFWALLCGNVRTSIGGLFRRCCCYRAVAIPNRYACQQRWSAIKSRYHSLWFVGEIRGTRLGSRAHGAGAHQWWPMDAGSRRRRHLDGTCLQRFLMNEKHPCIGNKTRTAGVMATVDDQSLYSSMLATAALRASAHWLESFR